MPPTERETLEQLQRLQRVTDVALRHLSVDELLDELLIRVREITSTDTAAVLIMDRDSNELVARAAKGLEEEVQRGVRIPMSRGFAGRIASEQRPIVLRKVDHNNVLNPILREKGVRSLLGVPLIAQGSVIGVLHVGTLTERHFSAADIQFLQLVADRVALALHVRLYEQERMITDTLQRTFLPEALPEIPGMRIATRYIPAAETAVVGGDWYDAFLLPDGNVALAIGDVAGHGVAAASVMGRIRNSLRAYALDGDPPARVAARLDRMVAYFDPGELVTLLFGVIDPELTSFRYASAGHMPPLIVDGAGPRFVAAGGEQAGDPPLGASFGGAYRETEAPLEPTSSLLLYTDGIIERRDTALGASLERLRLAAGAAATVPDPHDALSTMVDGLLEDGRPVDDVALLLVRLEGGMPSLRLTLSASPRHLAVIRRALRQWLARLPVSREAADGVITASGEACSNAIQHAYGLVGGPIHFQATFEGGVVEVTVRDEGSWRDHRRGSRGGRGAQLMQASMDSVEIERSQAGTVVRMRKAARPA